jgi:hypothetical protein
MTDYEYTTTLQPISVYGYRFGTATVIAAGESATATEVSFGRDVKILARLDGATVVTGDNGKTIPTTVNSVATKVGDKFYFLVQ